MKNLWFLLGGLFVCLSCLWVVVTYTENTSDIMQSIPIILYMGAVFVLASRSDSWWSSDSDE